MLGCFTLHEHVVSEPLPEKFEPRREFPRAAARCETPRAVNAALLELSSRRRAKLVEDHQLAHGEPLILCILEDSQLVFCTETLLNGGVDIVAKLLRSTLRP